MLTFKIFTSALLVTSALALPSIDPRQVNPDAVEGTQCNDSNVELDSHDTNVAILSICGGISGAITKCEGNPTETEGTSGTAKFSLKPLSNGATLNVSKGRWEGCVRAAAAVCPKGTYTSTCIGGTSEGKGFTFSLEANN